MRLTVSAAGGAGAGACGRIARSNGACPRRLGAVRAGRSAADAPVPVGHRSLVERLPGALARSAYRRRLPRRRRRATAWAAPARGCCAASATRFDAVERRFARVQGHRARAVFLDRLPRQPRRADDADRAGDVIFSDARNHASLIDGVRLSRARRVVFPHNDVDRLACAHPATSRAPASASSSSNRCSAWTAISRRSPASRLCAAPRGAVLIVDEAHAVGVYGPTRRGTDRRSRRIDGVPCISINTAGKALGVAGAFVAGPAWSSSI